MGPWLGIFGVSECVCLCVRVCMSSPGCGWFRVTAVELVMFLFRTEQLTQ